MLGHMMWFWIDVRGKGGVYQSCTFEGEPLLEPLLHLIEHDGQNDDQASDDLFPKFLNSEEHEAIGEDAHDECADDRSPDRATSAGQRSTAEHDSGDRVQLIAFSSGGVRSNQLGGGDQAGHRGAHAAEHVNRHFDSIHVDAGKLGRALVASDSIDLAPKRCLTRDEGARCREKHHDPDHDGNAQKAAGAKEEEAGIPERGITDEVGECGAIFINWAVPRAT